MQEKLMEMRNNINGMLLEASGSGLPIKGSADVQKTIENSVDVAGSVDSFAKWIKDQWTKIVKFISDVYASAKNSLLGTTWGKKLITKYNKFTAYLKKAMASAKDFWKDTKLWQKALLTLGALLLLVAILMVTVGDGVGNAVADLIGAFQNTLNTTLDSIKSGIRNIISDPFGGVLGILTAILAAPFRLILNVAGAAAKSGLLTALALSAMCFAGAISLFYYHVTHKKVNLGNKGNSGNVPGVNRPAPAPGTSGVRSGNVI